jgi:hypothetical protein
VGPGEDVQTDPLHFLAGTDAKRRCCAVACWSGEDLIGVLFATTRFLGGIPTGCALAGDFSGRGSVLCLPQHQALVIQSAVNCLMHNGIHSLHVCYLPAHRAPIDLNRNAVKQFDQHIPGDRLLLAATYDEFLSTLGKRTRRNIRSYTRRSVAAGIVFTSEISAFLYSSTVRQMSRGTRFSIGPASLARVERLMELHRGERFALLDRSGAVVAALCGFSKDGRFHVLSQINDPRHASLSLSIVLRGFVANYLIATGHSEIQFMGGSSVSLVRHCTPLNFRALAIDRRTSIATPFKMACGKLCSLLRAWNRPIPSALAFFSGSFLDSNFLMEHGEASSPHSNRMLPSPGTPGTGNSRETEQTAPNFPVDSSKLPPIQA